MVSVVRRLVGHFRRYRITPSSIWLRQSGGWVEIRRGDIAALKFETVSRIIVRYFNGQRFIVSLYQFSNPAYDAVCRSLRPEPEMCGDSREQAMRWLGYLEDATQSPAACRD